MITSVLFSDLRQVLYFDLTLSDGFGIATGPSVGMFFGPVFLGGPSNPIAYVPYVGLPLRLSFHPERRWSRGHYHGVVFTLEAQPDVGFYPCACAPVFALHVMVGIGYEMH